MEEDNSDYIRQERAGDEERRRRLLESQKKENSKAQAQEKGTFSGITSRYNQVSESIKRRQVERQLNKEKKAIDHENKRIERQRAAEVKIFGQERTEQERLAAQQLRERQEREKSEKWEKRKTKFQEFNQRLSELNSSLPSPQVGNTNLPNSGIDYSGLDYFYNHKPKGTQKSSDPLMDMFVPKKNEGVDPLSTMFRLGGGSSVPKKGKKKGSSGHPLDFV